MQTPYPSSQLHSEISLEYFFARGRFPVETNVYTQVRWLVGAKWHWSKQKCGSESVVPLNLPSLATKTVAIEVFPKL